VITIALRRGKDGRLHGFSVSGHSGYAEHGSDIVCAGVSAIVQTALLGLQEVLGIECSGYQVDGELSCCLPEGLSPSLGLQADLLLRTMLVGLRELASAYQDYVCILDSKEV
jgi:uncharacterized protein YsxB (DUF464 family)